jgi:hypothetical protein
MSGANRGPWRVAIACSVFIGLTTVCITTLMRKRDSTRGRLIVTNAFSAATRTLRGTVRNSSGGVVPGARVSLTSLDTGITYTSTPDSSGSYAFAALPVRSYSLTVTLPGFDPWQSGILDLSEPDGIPRGGMGTAADARRAVLAWQIRDRLETLAIPALMILSVIASRWLLMRLYRRAIVREMRKRNAATLDVVPRFPKRECASIEARTIPDPSREGMERASFARRAARRQAFGRWAAVVLAALVQNAAMVLFGGIPLIENPTQPLVRIVAWQAQLFFGSVFFLLAIIVPALIRSGQTSAVSWWLFAIPVGLAAAAVPSLLIGSQIGSVAELGIEIGVSIVLGYGVLVGSLGAALLAKRLLRLSAEAFAFVLAGLVGAATNAGVLVLETGTSLSWAVLFAAAAVVIVPAPYIVGLWTATRHAPLKLLFLRTFGNASQSDHLLRVVCRTWLTSGEVHAIAGPDIAVSTASPEGVLWFATLRIGHHFIRSSADLEKRLHAARRRPALDGRYELQEYPCFEDTWRPTMERLAALADAILVDVRGYTTARLGTAFELATLSELGLLERALLIVDDSTPMEAVRAAIGAGGKEGEVATFRVSGRRSRSDIVPVLFSGIDAHSRKAAGGFQDAGPIAGDRQERSD